jgi:phosphatidyl-myo-inositol dimannoside synthase
MKSLLISGIYFPPMTGGISNFMASIAATLGRHQACCLTGVPAGNGTNGWELGVRTYRRPAAFRKEKHIQAAGFAAAILEIMLRERPRVVQLATAYDGYIGLWLRQWFKLPFVVYAHGNEVLDALQSSWPKPRLSLTQAARVLANSRFTAQLVEKAGVAPERIEIIHPGCDIDRFQPYNTSIELRQEILRQHWNSRVILSVGNLVVRKGHDMVIQALPRVLESVKDVVYLIVGDGPYRAALEKLARAVGVRERVIFAGRVGDERLPEIYALGDVFVMPSRERLESCDVEGFGMVFLEASACARPVVAGRSGGTDDAVMDGLTGLLVDPMSLEEISSAICRLLDNHDFAVRLGYEGRSRVVSNFAWSNIGKRIQGILDSVAQESSGHGLAIAPPPSRS